MHPSRTTINMMHRFNQQLSSIPLQMMCNVAFHGKHHGIHHVADQCIIIYTNVSITLPSQLTRFIAHCKSGMR